MARRLPVGSPQLIRRLNSAAVLRAIRVEGPISRAALSRTTGLSKPTVNEVAELLLESGYVVESDSPEEAERRPGRRARLLGFRSDAGHVLGIDIGARKVIALVADLDGATVASVRHDTTPRERRDSDSLLALVWASVDEALAAAEVEVESLDAVGVGTPGIVDPASGEVSLAPQLGGWEGIPLAARLEDGFACPVLVENEVRLSVLAERWRGGAQGIDDVFYVQLGVGIGGGILIGGNVYRGSTGAAGEIGYLPLFGERNGDDGLGPFEHAAGGTAFARLGRRAVEQGESSTLLELANGDLDAIDAETVFAAEEQGDAAAVRIVAELLERLARGVASAVTVLNPSTVVIGGGISRAGPRLLEPLEQRIRQLVPVAPDVRLSSLGDGAVALGAVRLALEDVEERLFDVTLVHAG
jgi:predicted NBD/HSP70 family sugar kinase